MRSCARRRRDAATIFIAFVICCVDLTARIRRRMSRREGMSSRLSPPSRGRRFPGGSEVLPELLQRLIQICLDRIVDLLLVGERREQLRLARVGEPVQL